MKQAIRPRSIDHGSFWHWALVSKLSHPMRRALLLFMISILLPGCLWRVGVNGKHFTQPGGVATVDSTALRLDGYYWRFRSYSGRGGDGYIVPLILWTDGTAAHFRQAYGAGMSPDSARAETDAFRRVHKAFVDNLTLEIDKRYNQSKLTVQWGGFRVFGDSISIQIFELNGPVRSWDPFEYVGPIVNDTTFVIDRVTRPRQPFAFSRKQEAIDPPWVFRFQPLAPSEKPTSDNWTQTHDALQ